MPPIDLQAAAAAFDERVKTLESKPDLTPRVAALEEEIAALRKALTPQTEAPAPPKE